MSGTFDDYQLPIKFDIEENDGKYADIIGSEGEWVWGLADFYGEYFDQTDNLIITGNDSTIQINIEIFIVDTTPESE